MPWETKSTVSLGHLKRLVRYFLKMKLGLNGHTYDSHGHNGDGQKGQDYIYRISTTTGIFRWSGNFFPFFAF